VIKANIGAKGRVVSPSPTCEETYTMTGDGRFVTCGKPAAKSVYHKRADKSYAMCQACAHHNINNRGGRKSSTRRTTPQDT
jgi:hypothetical protein